MSISLEKGQNLLSPGPSQYVAAIKSKLPDVRDKGIKNLRSLVESKIDERNQVDDFTKLMNDICRQLFELVKSTENSERMAGIMAIDELINVNYDEDTQIIQFANNIRMVFPPSATMDNPTMEMAAKTLGHLAKLGGVLRADFVDKEVKRALEWIKGDRVESSRYAAVMVLKELAENAPTLFYQHVSAVFEVIHIPLKDFKFHIRQSACEALRACLSLIAQRESRWRDKWYLSLYEMACSSITTGTADHIHGGLLILGELLRNTGEFMFPYFESVCHTVLSLKNSKDKAIKVTIIKLVARLANFSSSEIVRLEHCLGECVDLLLKGLSSPSERTFAFISLGKFALSVGNAVIPSLKEIVNLVHEALNLKKNRAFCPEALTCISMLAKACGVALEEYVHDLLDLMFQGGLSQLLVDALTEIATHVPSTLILIQERLINCLSIILQGVPFQSKVINPHQAFLKAASSPRPSRSLSIQTKQTESLSIHSSGWTRSLLVSISQTTSSGLSVTSPTSSSSGSLTESEVIILALQTLGNFNFSGIKLLSFMQQCVVLYLEDSDVNVRREAAMTCSKLLVIPGEDPQMLHVGAAAKYARILDRLITLAVADPDESIRRSVLKSFDFRFDLYLAADENLSTLFIALNDENFRVREAAFILVGRVAQNNPAYALGPIRNTLLQLLGELRFSGVSHQKAESAKLLSCLIKHNGTLMRPYVGIILDAMLPCVKDTNDGFAAAVIGTVGELSVIGRDVYVPHLDLLLPLLVEALQSSSSSFKRQIALSSLGKIIQSSGFVIIPYIKYPNLLGIILGILRGDKTSWGMRREVMKTIGIIGALEPERFKLNELKKGSENANSKNLLENIFPKVVEQAHLVSSSEDYYPSVAIAALMRILNDKSLNMHHFSVIPAVIFVFRSLEMKIVPFLNVIMPTYLGLMRSCDDVFREFLFTNLNVIVTVVKHNISKYVDEIFSLITTYWSENIKSILSLVEKILMVLKDNEVKVFFPPLLPSLLTIMYEDHTDNREETLIVIRTLSVCGKNSKDYVFLVVPALMRIIEQVDANLPIRLKAIEALDHICNLVNCKCIASQIIMPLCRVLSGHVDSLHVYCIGILISLAYQLREDYIHFIPLVAKSMIKIKTKHADYDELILKILSNQPIENIMNSRGGSGRKSIVDEESFADIKASPKGYSVNQQNLRKAGETGQRSNAEDWIEWMRQFSVELLRESPIPALRACHGIAQVFPPLARELFNAAFLSCWTDISDQYQDSLTRSIENALISPSIPTEILQSLLNLAEFMEHDDKALRIDIRLLGSVASKCNMLAKALHYKEVEFHTSAAPCIGALISINNKLGQPDAADGILKYAEDLGEEINESWYEKLGRWDDALELYERKQFDAPDNAQIMISRIRCLDADGEWERAFKLSEVAWPLLQKEGNYNSVFICIRAAAATGNWESIEKYLESWPQITAPEESATLEFFTAMLAIRKGEYPKAESFITQTRASLDNVLPPLIGESYNRAYTQIVFLQQLSEMEEIIAYQKYSLVSSREDVLVYRKRMLEMWDRRLEGCQRDVNEWLKIMFVRSLVIENHQHVDTQLQFVSLCRQQNRMGLALKALMRLGINIIPTSNGIDYSFLPHAEMDKSKHLPILYAFQKYLFACDEKAFALKNLREMVKNLDQTDDIGLKVKVHLKLGKWQLALNERNLTSDVITDVLKCFQTATVLNSESRKAWHYWAVMNFTVAVKYEKGGNSSSMGEHLNNAVRGIFKSIMLSPHTQSSNVLQDILRLLTIFFNHGRDHAIHDALLEGFNGVSVDTWLQVIPQLIARIHIRQPKIIELLMDLLRRLGKKHPQALIYSLTVNSTSQVESRRINALHLMDFMRRNYRDLVDQAQLVSRELIRVAILWHEIWHSGIEVACKFFMSNDKESMLKALLDMHSMVRKGPETPHERTFKQTYGRYMEQAYEWIIKYQKSRNEEDLCFAWGLYHKFHRNIAAQINKKHIKEYEMQFVSPALLEAKDLVIAVPGPYNPSSGSETVCIAGFSTNIIIISSKQRPRKISIKGSDGRDYAFLLKGHEDLRQDERVMQLFGLVNQLLADDQATCTRDLSLKRYSVTPLSNHAGVVEWVPNCDTLNQLISEYRNQRKINCNVELKLLNKNAGDTTIEEYEKLMVIRKIEVFETVLEQTTGQDLNKVLWLKSANSEIWLDRRTNYTRSLAVMSMVGYMLGLGDRHPSNIMLDRYTGKILHIDFGDCFEVTMTRDKYPEKIPFRLTRMLIAAMEVSGIEGSFRSTCEAVMKVLRDNKDSLLAMLEAFVHDPLISWRLLTPAKETNEGVAGKNNGGNGGGGGGGAGGGGGEIGDSPVNKNELAELANASPNRDREWELVQAFGPDGTAAPFEAINARALQVTQRIQDKLSGRDFEPNFELHVHQQVDRLILQATSNENLCQSYTGWCPFW